MAIATNIILNDKEKTLVEALWNIYILQDDNVRKAFLSRIEGNDYLLITNTEHYKQAMDDVENGRVSHYDSLKDFYKEMEL